MWCGLFDAVMREWDAIQVELHGRYTLSRLDAVVAYTRASSRVHDLLPIALSPVPSLVVVSGIDMLPLSAPSTGVLHQTPGLFFRVSFTGWVMAFMIIQQLHISSPTLPLSLPRLWTISTVVGVCCVTWYIGLGVVVGYPTPFAMQMTMPPWFIALTTQLYFCWRRALRTDAVARANLRRYAIVFAAQVNIILAYAGFNAVFTSVPTQYQAYASLGLPLMKLFFKNIVHRGVFHMEDLAPAVIVFNVDVFHAMFVSTAMQQAKTDGSVVVIMVVDTVQALVAVGEIARVIARIRRNAARCRELVAGTKDLEQLEAVGVVGYAQHLLRTYPRIRDHPTLDLPRHLRARDPAPGFIYQIVSFAFRRSTRRMLRIVPSAPVSVDAAHKPGARHSCSGPVSDTHRQHDQEGTVSVDALRLRSVRDALKILHMVEFYVLIEYGEVLIATVSALYMLVMANLENRAYYPQLASLTDAELLERVARAGRYAALELLSFAVFCAVVDRMVQWRVSTLRQLAFALRRHAWMVQTALIMWVYFMPQLAFEHGGADYTFQFKWLRSPSTTR